MAGLAGDSPSGEGSAQSSVPMPVALFVGSWLPYSETFVFDQLRLQRRLQTWVIAGSTTRHADRFPYAPITQLGVAEQVGYRYAGVAPSIERTLERSGARLLFAHFGLHGAFALPFARRRGLPLVVMFHGHDVGGLLPGARHSPRYFRYQRLAPALFEYASLLLCASAELKDVLLALGAPGEKLRVHHLGIDLSRFSAAPERPRWPDPTIVSVGRLVEKKGIAYGLRAFREVLTELPTARLRIVGDGPLKDRLVREARGLGIDERVTFTGALAHDRVVDEMQRAHVLMTPSTLTAAGDRESGVLVLKEAAAVGLPAVATRHGGIPEVVEHERTGLLVPERAVSELGRALRQVLGNPTFAQELGAAARRKAHHEFDARQQVDRLEQLLLSVVSSRSSRRPESA